MKKLLLIFITIMLMNVPLSAQVETYDENEFVYTEELLKKANSGDPQAMFDIAQCYHLGSGIERNFAKCIQWTQKAVDAGLENGEHVLETMKKLVKMKISFSENPFLEELKYNAELGDTKYMHMLGYVYFRGKDIEKNNEKSLYWFNKSVEKGNTESIRFLAGIRSLDPTFPIDEKRSFELYKKGSELGDSTCMYFLALSYGEGTGTEKNEELCLQLMKNLATNGYVEAIQKMAEFYYFGDIVEKNFTTAAYWFRKGARLGHAESMNALSICYLKGEGTVQNIEQGVVWAKKAAAAGNAQSMNILGSFMEKGIYFEQNDIKADKLYTASGAVNADDIEYAMTLLYEVFPDLKNSEN